MLIERVGERDADRHDGGCHRLQRRARRQGAAFRSGPVLCRRGDARRPFRAGIPLGAAMDLRSAATLGLDAYMDAHRLDAVLFAGRPGPRSRPRQSPERSVPAGFTAGLDGTDTPMFRSARRSPAAPGANRPARLAYAFEQASPGAPSASRLCRLTEGDDRPSTRRTSSALNERRQERSNSAIRRQRGHGCLGAERSRPTSRTQRAARHPLGIRHRIGAIVAKEFQVGQHRAAVAPTSVLFSVDFPLSQRLMPGTRTISTTRRHDHSCEPYTERPE